MRLLRWIGVTVAVVIGVLTLPGVAGATAGQFGPTASGYSRQSGPSQKLGTSFGVTMCGFAPRTAIGLAVNGTSVPSATPGTNGCATFTVVMTDPHLAVNGGPAVAIHYGSNEVIGIGSGLRGAAQTDTYTFPVLRGGSVSSAGFKFAGADVLATLTGTFGLLALGFLIVIFSRRRIPRF